MLQFETGTGRVIFLFWVHVGLVQRAIAQICYFPGDNADQDRAVEQFPCNPYAYTTLCCPLGWTCFSNSLCVVTDETAAGGQYSIGTALRGTCTNPLWNGTACGDFCLDDLDNGSLQSCGNGNWCCQSSVDAGSCDCESGEGTFSIPDGEAQTIIGVQGLGSTSTNLASPSTSSAAQMTSSTASSTTSTSSSSPTSSPISTSTSSTSKTSETSKTSSSQMSTSKTAIHITSSSSSSHVSPTPTSNTCSSTASTASASSTHPALSVTHTTGFKVGIAVTAVIIALAIIAFLLWFFWWRHRERDSELGPMFEADSDIYTPEPTSAVPGPLLRPNRDSYEYRGNDGLRLSPISEIEESRYSRWSGGYSGGFAGRATDDRMGPVVDPHRMPYDGT